MTAVAAVAVGLGTAASLSALPRGDEVIQAALAGAPQAAPAPEPAEPESVEPFHEGIALQVRHTDFTPTVTAVADEHTSVWVEIENGSAYPLAVQSSAFFLSDAEGRALEPALRADVRELGGGAMFRLEPGERAAGAVTAQGDVLPASLDFYPDNSGIPVTAPVEGHR